MVDIKKIEEGLKFLDDSLAATRRFHGIDTESLVPKQAKWWWRWCPAKPTLINLYDQLYNRFEARLASLCAELLPLFKVFVHGDGVCIDGKPGSVGWLKIKHHHRHQNPRYPSDGLVDTLTIHFSAHKIYTYTKHSPCDDGEFVFNPYVESKMELYSSPDVLLRLIGMWPEFQPGLNDWLTKLEETNCRKVNEALVSLGV